MYFSLISRQRRRLLMQLDPSRTSRFASSSSSSSLKRPYSQQALALAPRSRSKSPSRSNPPFTTERSSRLSKVPKLEGSQSPGQVASSTSPPPPPQMHRQDRNPPPTYSSSSSGIWRHEKPGVSTSGGGGGGGRGSGARVKTMPPKSSKGRGKGRAGPQRIQGPVCDVHHIEATYKIKPIKAEWIQNPKSPVSNFMMNALDSQPVYEPVQVLIENGQQVWRCISFTLLFYGCERKS